MAKKLITSYTFTPGVSGAGTIAIAGTYTLEQFLLVTNVVYNIVIYAEKMLHCYKNHHVENSSLKIYRVVLIYLSCLLVAST